MPTFKIKIIKVPLFGVVENSDQAEWLSTFSASHETTQVHIDPSAFDMIAEDLELDAEGLVSDAERYVNGSYRSKARGMSGSSLGDLGEVLTYLVNRVQVQEITRVVSWRAGNGQVIKGERFPQPDFIVKNSNLLAALEVKSTEAYDFVDLRDKTQNWRFLRPCSSVGSCRELALPQLGFVGGILTPPQHSLVVRSGNIVPFPVGKGIATAVVAVDGRVNDLRSDPKFKTPPECRLANRNCWACLPVDCHFALVTMPNSPGMLSLGGAAGDSASSWFRAYKRWTQALSSRDLLAVRESLKILTESLILWLKSNEVKDPEVLRSFWGAYLGDVMRSRGLDVELPEQFGDLRHLELDFEWIPAELAKPVVREASMQNIANMIFGNRRFAISFMTSEVFRWDSSYKETVTIRGERDWVEFHLLSETWWKQGAVETIKDASFIASRVITAALEISGWPFPPDYGIEVPLKEISALVGNHEIPLGWELKPIPLPTVRELYNYIRKFDHALRPLLPIYLAIGDPRIQIRVRPEGRATLRFPRRLLRHA